MNKLALVRSLHHPMRNHNSAAAEVFTGRTPAGGDQELLIDDPRSVPNIGSAVGYALGERAHVLPYVALPYTLYNVVQLPGQTPGLLGGAFDRFQVEDDPSSPNFRLSAFDGTADMSNRAGLLRGLDRTTLPDKAARAEVFRDRALHLLADPNIRKWFDVAKEPERVRERYGKGRFGQSLLLARRLVEGGVNFVSVYDGQRNGQEANWDSHEKLFPRHRQLIPPSDVAFSALIEDLESRGPIVRSADRPRLPLRLRAHRSTSPHISCGPGLSTCSRAPCAARRESYGRVRNGRWVPREPGRRTRLGSGRLGRRRERRHGWPNERVTACTGVRNGPRPGRDPAPRSCSNTLTGVESMSV